MRVTKLLGGQPTALVVVQTEAPTPELVAENPILLAKVVNDNGDQHEPGRAPG
jgi:hypothetical protein